MIQVGPGCPDGQQHVADVERFDRKGVRLEDSGHATLIHVALEDPELAAVLETLFLDVLLLAVLAAARVPQTIDDHQFATGLQDLLELREERGFLLPAEMAEHDTDESPVVDITTEVDIEEIRVYEVWGLEVLILDPGLSLIPHVGGLIQAAQCWIAGPLPA